MTMTHGRTRFEVQTFQHLGFGAFDIDLQEMDNAVARNPQEFLLVSARAPTVSWTRKASRLVSRSDLRIQSR